MSGTVDMVEMCEDNALSYASAVNLNRAIPDARTGLKPIHQKILWEMHVDGVSSDKKYRKCAYMVGQVVARFSPHGDAATYDAMMRLSQQWLMEHPLIDVHGNNGSQFGDGSAAMRYVEARLSPVAEDGFLATVDNESVEFGVNYTNDEREPLSLPAVFPGLFCLPNQGIGYACASYFMTFNLREVADALVGYINDGEWNTLYFDLASGGTYSNPSGMDKIAETGVGKVVIDSKYSVSGSEITFVEFPFNVAVDDIMDDVISKCDSGKVSNVKEVRNDSGDGVIRLTVVASEPSKVDSVISCLLEHTKLRTSYSINQTALVDGYPKVLSQRDMADAYVSHNLDCIMREARHEHDKSADRCEVLSGLLLVADDTEKAVKIIHDSKSSSEAKKALVEAYGMTDKQASSVLEMRLSKLTNTEVATVRKELAERTKDMERVQKLIDSEKDRRKLLVKRLSALADKYAVPRRTVVSDVPQTVPVKDMTRWSLTIDEVGNICKDRADDGWCDSDVVVMLSREGLAYRVRVGDIRETSERAGGVPLCDLVKKIPQLREQPKIGTIDPGEILIASSAGMVKRVNVRECFSGSTRDGYGKFVMNEQLGERVLDYDPQTKMTVDKIVMYSSDGYSIAFKASDVPLQKASSRGVVGMKLHDGAECVRVEFLPEFEQVETQRRGGVGRRESSS